MIFYFTINTKRYVNHTIILFKVQAVYFIKKKESKYLKNIDIMISDRYYTSHLFYYLSTVCVTWLLWSNHDRLIMPVVKSKLDFRLHTPWHIQVSRGGTFLFAGLRPPPKKKKIDGSKFKPVLWYIACALP